MSKSIGCIGCLTICCAMVRNHGSSMRKGLFRNGRRHTVARSNAGHAQASTATNESRPTAPDPLGSPSLCLSPKQSFSSLEIAGQSSGD